MGIPPAPTSHLYPQSLQLQLYQAFIFSIPILFSVILFLLFYLFYLKRRTSSSLPPLPIRSLHETLFASSSEIVMKGNLKDVFPTVLFDEDLRTMDSMCSVCLGDFEIKEELHQIPTCKHMFHADCIRDWVRSNPTCPLCRCFIFSNNVHGHSQPPPPPFGPNQARQDNQNFNHNPHMVSQEQQQQQFFRSLNADMAISPARMVVDW